jgi:hypothetical protein
VVSGSRAISGEVVAGVSQSAQSGSSFESQTVSARIVGSATRRNKDTSTLSITPFETSITNTFASSAIVVVGASSGNVVAGVGSSAPGGIRIESQARSTIVVGGTASWNINASVLSGAPGLVGGAETLSGLTVVSAGSRTEGGNIVASISD